MMRSLYSAVSGLKNHQTRMDVIGNNIANINTTGFKANRVNFSSMLSQNLSAASSPQGNLGGVNAKQIGLGSAIASIDTLTGDGSVQSTGQNTDLAISGNGYFVLKEGEESYYTRDGSFRFDEVGNYVSAGGLKVQGWMADDEGVVSTNSEVTDIIVPAGQTMSPSQTTKIDITKNLSAEEEVLNGKIVIKAAVTGQNNGTVQGTFGDGYYKIDTNTNEITIVYESYAAYVAESGNNSPTVGNAAQLPATLAAQIQTDTGNQVTANSDTVNTIEEPGKSGSVVITVPLTLPTPPATLTGIKQGTFVGGTYNIVGSELTITYTNYDAYVNAARPNRKVDPIEGETTDIPPALANEIATATGYVFPTPPNGTAEKVEKVGVIQSIITYDSEGIEHKVSILYTKMGNNRWNMEVQASSDGDTISNAKGVLQFDEKGDFVSSTLNEFEIVPTNGTVDPLEISLNFNDETFTQYAGSTNVKADPDGYTTGTLDSVDFDSVGCVIGTFSNGQKKTLAQVAMATFNNPGGLESAGSNLYSESKNSGTAQISASGANGAGEITPSALEMSNANLGEQFTDMIVTQRGYQSNSKIITVSDEMLETAINMKR